MPPRMCRRSVRSLLPLGVACVLLGGASARASESTPLAPERLRELVRADSLLFARSLAAQRFDSLEVALDAHIPLARAGGHRQYLTRLLSARGIAWLYTGQPERADLPLAESQDLALELGDSARALLVLQQRTYALGARGLLEEQRRLALQLRDLAGRSFPNFRAIAENFLGWNASERGLHREAMQHLEQAVAVHRQSGNENDEAIALSAYASTLIQLGEYAAAEGAYARQLELSQKLANPWYEGQACDGLGVVEEQIGDQARALQFYERARAIHQARSSPIDEALVLLKLARVELSRGQPQAGAAAASQALAICEQGGFARVRASALLALANAQAELGQTASAQRGWQAVLELDDDADPDVCIDALLQWARSLRAEGHLDEARVAVESGLERLLPRASRSSQHALWLEASEVGRLDGDAPAALGYAARAIESAEAATMFDDARRAYEALAMASEDRGQSQLAYERAAELWTQLRARSLDPQWRAWWGHSGSTLGVRYASFLEREGLADVETAFAIAQRFKAATLRERTRGPRHGPSDSASVAVPTLAELRARLHDDELLLEWFLGAEESLLFVIDREACTMQRLPAAARLESAIEAARDLFTDPQSRPEDWTTIAHSLGELLFGALDPPVRAHWILAPDGVLHRVPFTVLLEQLPAAQRPHSHWLVAASGLLRAQEPASTAAETRLFLHAGDPTLAGSAAERRFLRERLQAVDELPLTSPQLLCGYALLHFCGHARPDDLRPWRSGIELDGAGTLLLAEEITELDLRAELVVLANCASAGGRVQSGEGVSSLATAFLLAGARATIASLWPVDDAVTARLMRPFYEALAQGATVGEALARAQGVLRAESATAHPIHWAAFVAGGDAAIRPQPRLRRLPPRQTLAGLLGAGALGLVAYGWSRRRSQIGA